MSSAYAPDATFESLLEPHRAALQAHCYRMLGSAADAEDAVQDALLRAWRALPGFEGRSSLRAWLYRIATNVCLRMLERRPARILAAEHGPPGDPRRPAAPPAPELPWLEPYPDAGVPDDSADPQARYEQRESVELAFVAALQHLPHRQRAVLLLRDVLGFSPAEIAATLDASPAAIYSALQRAHAAVDERLPARSQQATLRALGDEALRTLVDRYVDAWERADVPALVALLTDDATFAMPPRPSWYRGREAVGAFLAQGPLAAVEAWERVPVRANAQPAFLLSVAGQGPHAVEVLEIAGDGRIAGITVFMDAATLARFA